MLNYVAPKIGVPGAVIDIYGYFLQNTSTTIRVGSETCQILELNGAQITCMLPLTQKMGKQLLSVTQETAGDSIGKIEYIISPVILSVYPDLEFSVFGGALVTRKRNGLCDISDICGD
jgi:hypothetical protein